MRLLTLPRCAVKRCFELIKLEWFPGLFFEFPAMFDYFWYLHTGNRNPSLFPYQQGTILSAMNGCVCQHRLCFFIMFPCMNQSGAWKTQRGDTVTPPQGCTEQNPQDAFSLWYGINHFLREACGKKKKKTLSRVLIDKISKREEGDEGCNKRNHPTSVSRSRGEGEWEADGWNELPRFECGMWSVLVWGWWWSIELREKLSELKQSLFMSVYWCDDGMCICVCVCVWQLDVLDGLGGGRSQRQHRADRESLDGRIQPPHFRHLQHAVAQRPNAGPQHQHHVLVRRLLRSHREDSSQRDREDGEFQCGERAQSGQMMQKRMCMNDLTHSRVSVLVEWGPRDSRPELKGKLGYF